MNENINPELRERARRRRVQGIEYVSIKEKRRRVQSVEYMSIEEIRKWLTAESRASEHPFIRRVTAATLAELDAALARVATLEVVERQARAILRIHDAGGIRLPDTDVLDLRRALDAVPTEDSSSD